MVQQPSHFAGRLDEAFIKLLRGLRSWDFGRGTFFQWFFQWSPFVPDPALPDENVAKRWGSVSADGFGAKLDGTLRTINALERSRSEDTEVAKWQKIFGDPFPRPTALRRR